MDAERLFTFQCQNLLVRVHNRRVRSDWSTENIVGVGEVDDNHFVLLIDLLSYADQVVGSEW